MRSKIIKCIIAASIILISCGDEHQFFPTFEKADPGSVRIRFVHAASDTVGVNLFLDDIKISGSASSALSNGVVNQGRISFGADFPAAGYATVNDVSGNLEVIFPETYTVSLTYPTKTMSSINTALDASSWYTVAFVGVSPAYETVVFEDNMDAAPIDGKAYIRFANFIDNLGTDELTLKGTPPATLANPAPVPIILFQDVSYKEMTDFIPLPTTGVYTNLQIVNETTAGVVYTLAPATSSLYSYTGNKAYTLYAKGRIAGAGVAAPGFGRMLNR